MGRTDNASRQPERVCLPPVKVLLTGANGFVGRQCALALIRQGCTVVTTDRSGAVELLGDLSSPSFCQSLPDVHAVVHAAAVQYVSADLPLLSRAGYFERNNVQATLNLVARYAGSGAHFVNVATSMMYAQNNAPIYSTHSPRLGQGVYSRSKLTAQRIVEASGLHWATVVPCIIGGRGREGLFRGFVSSIVKHGRVVFPGSGQHPVHMVHVNDVADLLALVVKQRVGGCFNAAAPSPLSITDWVREIADELGVRMPRVVRLPLSPLHALAAITRYRLLAREQLLMLAQPHVLDTASSLALGWQPQFDNARIARDIGRHIAESMTT